LETQLTALDFFAGSGLVTYALKPHFKVIWANDISSDKANVYKQNHGEDYFVLDDISNIKGKDLPMANLSWASFPCQDLSLAGNGDGIFGERSGLVWQWLRIIDEMQKIPDVLVAENVEGLVSSLKGNNYISLHNALVSRGYNVGAVLLNANKWVPQSRPRVFVIAAKNDIDIPQELISTEANWAHSKSIRSIASLVDNWVWWQIPKPEKRESHLKDIVEWNASTNDQKKTEYLLSLLSEKHKQHLNSYKDIVATGYKRTRHSVQRLELRFDGIAGCLRTPKGGSSKQTLVIKRDGHISTRLLTARETARLMGAPNTYWLPENYNETYMAMGDAVVVPVVNCLAEHILAPLILKARKQNNRKEGVVNVA
jgi:DNA (cytosine-5)-methyltransferase 1